MSDLNSAPHPNPPLVLIVEDDSVNARFTSLYLKRYFTVDVAADGLKALKAVNEKQYDIILMDINLGRGLNGFEVVKEIKKIDGYSKTHFIGISAFSINDDIEAEINKTFSHYLAKPYSSAELLEVIKHLSGFE